MRSCPRDWGPGNVAGMKDATVRPPVDLVVIPFQLGSRDPYVLVWSDGRRLSLLRVPLMALDRPLEAIAEHFLVRTIGMTVSPLSQSIATQDLERQPAVAELCYYGFAKSRFTNGERLVWIPLYQHLPDEDRRHGEDLVQWDTPTCQLSDHDIQLLLATLTTLRRSLDRKPVIQEIEPEAFTLSYLQQRTEMLLGVSLHTQNFRRKILDSGYLEPLDIVVTQTAGRPALLYRVTRPVGSKDCPAS